MTDIEIINVIKHLHKECECYKDGGITFIKCLAQKLNNTIDEDKNAVYDLFYREIRTNDNSYIESIALETYKELKDKSVCPVIEKIYREVGATKNEEWKRSIIDTLMVLKYDKPKDIYYEYVCNYLRNNYNNALYVLIQYSNVDWEHALPLLSSYYAENLLQCNNIRQQMIVRIGYLIHYFMENKNSYFSDLLKRVAIKNKNAALSLRQLIISYLNENTSSSNYTKERSKNVVEELISIEL